VTTDVERVERRILCAVSFVDATTGRPVRDVLTVISPADVRLVRNHSAKYVFLNAPNLSEYTQTFEPTPPMPPAIGTINLSVRDPSRGYLSRSFSVDLPRSPDLGPPLPANSVFQPVVVRLFPAPAASISSDWAAVRAHVSRGSADMGGVLVRVIRQSDGARIGTGVSDDRAQFAECPQLMIG
jgi:hypothetical protein